MVKFAENKSFLNLTGAGRGPTTLGRPSSATVVMPSVKRARQPGESSVGPRPGGVGDAIAIPPSAVCQLSAARLSPRQDNPHLRR